MKCPVDGSVLTMTERSGVEIDFCPDCRGVWLDRGELDKILDRAGGNERSERNDRTDRPARDDQGPRGHDDDHDHEHDQGRGMFGRRKKRESFLSDLFDFG